MKVSAKLEVVGQSGTPTIKAKIQSTTAEVAASGGVFRGGKRYSIPQYAGGTSNAHGSMFIAGEAGPEIVGHIGGRTEVLNRSQLASTMFASVSSAMRYRERYTPHLAVIGASVSRSEQHLAALARQAEAASSGGNARQIVALLSEILVVLKQLDFDVYLDGESVKDRIVKLINQTTRANGGLCEIVI